MLSWKQNQHGTTSLLIRGARRVGKSTVAEEFARREYESYILVDFSKATPNIREVRNQSSHRSPSGEERTMEESRKKLINMGIPLHPKDGYVLTAKLKEGTNAFNLYNSMVKNTDWYNEYKVLIWMAQKEQYDNIMESIKLISSTIKQSLIN